MNGFLYLAVFEFWGVTFVALPAAAGLAAVALVGYIFGTRTRSRAETEIDGRRQRELERAAGIAWHLETVADRLRKDLATHHSQVELFKNRLRRAQSDGSEESWKDLCGVAESVLGPTMQMAQRLSHAYDEIRQQSDALETFAQGRTDPLTGVGNGRALEGQLQVLLTASGPGPADFVVAIVSLDRLANSGPESEFSQVALLPGLAGIIRSCMRDSDFVARFGDEEFVVVMPQTTLAGSSVFGERLRNRVATELDATICCGLAAAISGDDSKSLLARADSALYSAKASGRNRLFLHTGTQIREHRPDAAEQSCAVGPRQASGRTKSALSRKPNPMSGETVSPDAAASDDVKELVGAIIERD
jgi:diguanylate cyclase